jgi:hypothetical protein
MKRNDHNTSCVTQNRASTADFVHVSIERASST